MQATLDEHAGFFTRIDLINYMEGYFPGNFKRLIFQYVPQQAEKAAALSSYTSPPVKSRTLHGAWKIRVTYSALREVIAAVFRGIRVRLSELPKTFNMRQCPIPS